MNVAEGRVRRLTIRLNVSIRKRVLKVDFKVLENRTATIKDGKGYQLFMWNCWIKQFNTKVRIRYYDYG